MTLQEVLARLEEIRTTVEARGAVLTEEELQGFEDEVVSLQERRRQLEASAERRSRLLGELAEGTPSDPNLEMSPVNVLRRFADAEERVSHITDTREYRTAFMNYICRNVAMPRELRTAENTTVADTGAVIPNTIMNEIIRELDSYGNLYAGFRKINMQGGVSIPIAELKPTAHWIGESATSDDQKLTSKTSVTFSYHGLECKISQSILASVVTLEMFQSLFVPLATEAMVKAIEIASISGDGSGKPLGVTLDPRVTKVVTLTAEEAASWSGWSKNVKAKIKKAYRNGVFIMNQGTFDGYIDGMVDANGQPIGRINYGINGEETYRFMGKEVETVDDDIIASMDDAEVGDVIGIFMKLSDYVINSNMSMTANKWTDHDENKVKNKLMMVVDGKIADANGVILIKKAESVEEVVEEEVVEEA